MSYTVEPGMDAPQTFLRDVQVFSESLHRTATQHSANRVTHADAAPTSGER